MKKSPKKFYGFTLVELIIVITILAILSTVAFVSFQGYTKSSRDSNRLYSIKQISKSLEIGKTTIGKFPEVENQTGTGVIGGVILSKVGVLGDNASKILKIDKTPTDPITGNKYLYGVSYDNKYYQIAGTFENLNSSIINTSYADAGNFKAKVEGNYKGIITYSTGGNNYISNLPSLIFLSGGTLDLINQEGYFVINNGKNLPYLIDNKTTQYNQTSSGVLKDLNGVTAILTGTIYNLSTTSSDLSSNIGVLKDTISYELGTSIKQTITATECNPGIDEVTLSNGQTWSCKNLGATTVRDGSSTFTCNSSSDCSNKPSWDGDYYQWGKNTTAWVNGSAGLGYDWQTPQQPQAWGGSASDTTTADAAGTTLIGRQGPCPAGWRVPSAKDWQDYCNNVMGFTCTNGMSFNSKIYKTIKLAPSGNRIWNTGAFDNQGGQGLYWSSSPSGIYSSVMQYSSVYINQNYVTNGGYASARSYGFTIRCIKN